MWMKDEHIVRRMLDVDMPGKRRRGWRMEREERDAQKRWLDNISDEMKEYNMTEHMVENRSVWRMKIKAGPLLHGGGLEVSKYLG